MSPTHPQEIARPKDGLHVPAGVRTFVDSHRHFLVVGHKEPDGDCIASQIVCAELLSALGKSATLYSVGPFDSPEIAGFTDRFSADVPAELLGAADTAVVVVDCSTFDRVGGLRHQLERLPCMVVDHHASGEIFGDIRYVEPAFPATTLLILSLFGEFGVVPSAEQARLLLFGLSTDTGFFRHLGGDSAETLRAAARLTELGTSPADVFAMACGGRTLDNRKLLARMIERAESYLSDRLLLTWLTLDDRRQDSRCRSGDDDLYRLLQTVSGNEVVVLIKEEEKGGFSVGLRSTTADVGAVARSFGGGGHRCAAGFDMTGPLEKIRRLVLDSLLPLVEGLSLPKRLPPR